MKKTVTLKLESEGCKEEIEISKQLWERFEQKAKELGVPPEELAVIALDDYLKARGH